MLNRGNFVGTSKLLLGFVPLRELTWMTNGWRSSCHYQWSTMRNPIGKTGPRPRQTAFGLDSQSDVDRWMSDSPDAPSEISSKLRSHPFPMRFLLSIKDVWSPPALA